MTKTYKLALFATLIAFAWLGSTAVYGRDVSEFSRWVMLGVMCAFALWRPRPVEGSFSGTPLRLAALAFAALAVLSSLWSLQRSVYTFMRGVSVVLLVVFIFYSLWPRLRVLKDYVTVINVLSALAWVTVLANVVAWRLSPGTAVRPFTGAFQGMFGNPNTLGMAYVVLTPVAVARFHLRKTFLTAALPLALFGFLVISQSRAGLVGAVLGTGAFYAAYYGKKMRIPVILLFAILIPLMATRQEKTVLDVAEQDFWRGESNFSQYGSGRFGLWMAAYGRFKDRPFTGYGFGTAGDAYLPNGEPFRWHSSFTQIAVELGIIGLLYFAAPMVYSGVKVVKYHFLDVKDIHVRVAAAGLMGGWIGGAADSFFESWLFSVGNFTTVMAWIAFAAGVKAMSDAKLLSSMGQANAAKR